MTKDYICLACGNHFPVAPSADKKCSKCGSVNVLKLGPASPFGFFGG